MFVQEVCHDNIILLTISSKIVNKIWIVMPNIHVLLGNILTNKYYQQH